MTFYWVDDATILRCYLSEFVTVLSKDWGGHLRPYRTKDMGYVLHREGRLMAHVYGTINPDALGQWFDNIDEAKAYVEQQALLGLTLNKLTR